MSLIPLVILLGLILGAGYFLLQGEIKLPQFNRGPQLRRLEGFPTVIVTDQKLDKQRSVIKSQEELAEFLNYIDPTGLTEIRSPINFDKEFVLVASTDTQPESGHAIKIKKVYEDKAKKRLSIVVEETEQGANCEIEKESNIAADAVAISKTDWDIEFDKVKKIADCEDKSNSQSSDSASQKDTNN